MAEEKQNLPEMIDPIAYRDDYPLDAIIGTQANETFNQYGDDSDLAHQQQSLGGSNAKYSGEGTSVNYNPDVTTESLPSYIYGKQANKTGEEGYLTKRNDNVASALYNEGLTSRDDILNYLSQQQGWMNSSEMDRANTVEAIYKRIGQMQPKEEPREAPEINLPEATNGKLYGKTTAEEGNIYQGINTIPDANSIFAQMNQARVSNYKALELMSSPNIAMSIYNGTYPYGEQAYRDLQQFDMQKYQEVQAELKKLYTQDKVDGLTHGTSSNVEKNYIDTIEKSDENAIKNWEEANTNDDNIETVQGYLNEKLASNKTATDAKSEMMRIKQDINDLQAKINELPDIARKSFKGDVPDYIYKAFVANNQQKLQGEIEKLQNLYASYSDIYKTEVSNAQREAEYQLKVDEFNRQVTNDKFDQYIKTAQLELDSIQWGKDANGNIVGFKVDPATGTMVQITDETAIQTYNQSVEKVAGYANSLIGTNSGKQCLGFTNMLTQQAAGVQMVGAGGSTNPTLEERIEYATNPNVSDVIPIAGDVAVMQGNGKNGVNKTWGHVMYVDKVYQDKNGDTWFHYVASNTGKEGEKTKVYEGQMRVKDFYNNGGVGFWNPFKQAQYNAGATKTSTVSGENPMETVIDDKISSGKLNATQVTNISKFGYAYENLWRSQQLGELNSLLNEGAAARFMQELSVKLANTQSGQSVDSTVGSAAKMTLDEFIKQVEIYAGQQMGNGSSAYMGFMAIVGVIESKLRKESGAAINGSERAMDFLQYLPQAGDNADTMNRKLQNLETFLKYWAKEGGITGDQYIPLNLGKRQYD